MPPIRSIKLGGCFPLENGVPIVELLLLVREKQKATKNRRAS